HIAGCPACREELERLSAVWTKLGVLPEEQPPSSLRPRFYSMLEDYKSRMAEKKQKPPLGDLFRDWLKSIRAVRPAFQFSFALVFLCVGLAAGFILTGGRGRPAEVAQLRQELQSIKQTLAVSLLEKQSAIDRLRGVNLSYRMDKPGSTLLEALLDTLNSDSNVNVRLAAVDALYLFYDNPTVRAGVIQALSEQTSPLVQVALIDLMVTMRERRAVNSLKKLIQSETLNPNVKKHAELGLQQIGM
ncbi:MAG: HEAT repeat domain-containing protein, partial [Candidatus Aminicenantes bacterium]